MVLQEIAPKGSNRAYPEMRIIPEGKVIIAIIVGVGSEKIMVEYSHGKKQNAKTN